MIEEVPTLDTGTPDNKYHIAICIPTHETMPYQFAMALANMVGFTIHVLGDMVDITTHCVVGTYVHKAREQLLHEVMEMGAHYMLWLDSDHHFPKDALVRLLQHDKPIVGINYSIRGVPPRYVAIKRASIDNDDPALCPTRADSTGLESVEAIGFGMVLMKMVVADSLPKDEPKFFFHYDWAEKIHVGEDVYFCRMARKAGWEVLVDHDLSKECTHVGQMEYRLDHVWGMEEEGINVDYDVHEPEDDDSKLAESVGSDGDNPDDDPVGGEASPEGPEDSADIVPELHGG
jgi:hypothetical protein